MRSSLLALIVCCSGLFAQSHVHTDRPGKQLIQLPKRDDAFGFVIFGDRTGGRPSGLKILEQAVTDTNLLDPDFVMTVGDLIEGYNADDAWLAQMREFKGYMDALEMPWFPVAGNHDIYYRGQGKPLHHHEDNYETHFGPLWYAFEHRKCWFVVLYSDEGDRRTGAKAFNQPALQKMSPEQFAWLDKILNQAKGAPHVFVFLHHPRWLGGGYGGDWEQVHERLAKNGNVSAVFAGHIHRMRYDGKRDGIEYFALATTGGVLHKEIPQAGWLHHFNVVTVRGKDVSVATVPVGAVLDPRKITGEMSEDVDVIVRKLAPRDLRGVAVSAEGVVDGLLRMRFDNPGKRPIELTLTPGVGDDAWAFSPDHTHVVVDGGESANVTFSVGRRAAGFERFRFPKLQVDCDYLGEGVRISLPTKAVTIDVPPPASLGQVAATEPGYMTFDGRGDALRLPSAATSLPDGPITVEAWIRGRSYAGRRGLLAKTENSEYGIFVSDGAANFSVYLDESYRAVDTPKDTLKPNQWHHVAGVFDGTAVRLYVDGKLAGERAASGKRKRNKLPFYVGADVAANGRATSYFDGDIDEFRLSRVARYAGEKFEPARRFEPDVDTVVLLHMDRRIGPWIADRSATGAHAHCEGDVRAVVGSK